MKVAAALSKGSSAYRDAQTRARSARTVRVLEVTFTTPLEITLVVSASSRQNRHLSQHLQAMGVSVPPLLAVEAAVGLQELRAKSDVFLAMGMHSRHIEYRCSFERRFVNFESIETRLVCVFSCFCNLCRYCRFYFRL